MSSKRQKMKAAAKDVAKLTAHLVGVPVDRINKKIEEIVDVFNPDSVIDIRLKRMADHIEDINRMITEASSDEYQEELDQLKQSLGKLTHTLRDRSGSRAQHSALMGAIGAEELLVESSNRLTHYLGVFNTGVATRNGTLQSAILQCITIQNDAIMELQSELHEKGSEEELVDSGDLIPYRKLLNLKTAPSRSGVECRIEEATYKNQIVVVKTFVDRNEAAVRAWKAEIRRHKRYRHANVEKMWGVSPPSEGHPYIIVSPEGADIRNYFRERRCIADVYNFFDSITKTCGDLYRMGCYNWDRITVYPDGKPVIRPQFEDRQNLDKILEAIVKDTLRQSFGGRGIYAIWQKRSRGPRMLAQSLVEILQSRMIDEGCAAASELEKSLMAALDFSPEVEETIRVWEIREQRVRESIEGKRNDHAQLIAPLDSIVEAPAGTLPLEATNQPAQWTLFGVQSVAPYLSIGANRVWQAALSLILGSWFNLPLATRLRQDLFEWDSQGMVDWEYSLLQVIASYTPPSPTLRKLGYRPNRHILVGDVCSFGGGTDQEAGFNVACGLAEYDSFSHEVATSSFVSCNDQVGDHIIQSSGEWTSFTITPSPHLWRQPPDSFGIDVYSYLPSQAMQRVLWCNARRNICLVCSLRPESLSWLETVISTHLMVRIKWRSTGIKPLRWILGVGKDVATSNDKNAFPGKTIYFHRRASPSAPPREFWGFFSRNSDPNAESGLENCEVDYELEITTLPMKNEVDRELESRDEERMERIPGSYRLS